MNAAARRKLAELNTRALFEAEVALAVRRVEIPALPAGWSLARSGDHAEIWDELGRPAVQFEIRREVSADEALRLLWAELQQIARRA